MSHIPALVRFGFFINSFLRQSLSSLLSFHLHHLLLPLSHSLSFHPSFFVLRSYFIVCIHLLSLDLIPRLTHDRRSTRSLPLQYSVNSSPFGLIPRFDHFTLPGLWGRESTRLRKGSHPSYQPCGLSLFSAWSICFYWPPSPLGPFPISDDWPI